MLAKRYGISLALGAIVTTVLFLIMQAVIASDEAKLDEGAKGKLLELVRLEDDEEIQLARVVLLVSSSSSFA